MAKTTKIVPETSLERVFFSPFDTRRVPEILFLRFICSSLRVASLLELVVLFGAFVVVVVIVLMFGAFLQAIAGLGRN